MAAERGTCEVTDCGRILTGRGEGKDLMSASIDHVIPLARGGKHERANAQTSHFVCNVTKGARLLDAKAV